VVDAVGALGSGVDSFPLIGGGGSRCFLTFCLLLRSWEAWSLDVCAGVGRGECALFGVVYLRIRIYITYLAGWGAAVPGSV